MSDDVPDFQTLMLPVLRAGAAGEIAVSDVVDALADEFALTDDQRAELIPSGGQTKFSNRIQWARTYLGKARLIEATKRGHFRITERGVETLSKNPKRIDVKYLKRFPEFLEFKFPALAEQKKAEPKKQVSSDDLTPDERMRAAHKEIFDGLASEILDRLKSGTPAFFEAVTVSLLVAMGYGGSIDEAGRAIGKSGDDGVDGVIDEDSLGLDRIYVQAKRYDKANVGPGEIRDFFGALDQKKALKGIFITTSGFTVSARETADRLSKRIVLIDGLRLARLMIEHNVGCRVVDALSIKKLDEDFFDV